MQRKFYIFHPLTLSLFPSVAALGPSNSRAFEAGCRQRSIAFKPVTEAEALRATLRIGGIACGAYMPITGQDEEELRKAAVQRTLPLAEICDLYVTEEPIRLEEPRELLYA